MMNIAVAAIITWVIYYKTKKWYLALLSGVVSFCIFDTFVYYWWPSSTERFNGFACADFLGVEKYPRQRSPSMQFGPPGPLVDAYPGPLQAVEYTRSGDNTLTNLYRRVHNLDAIQRTENFQFSDTFAGGSYGIQRQPFLGEAYDRAMMHMNEQIRQEIAQRRLPFSEAYDVPTKPMMGNFYDYYIGDYQVQADADGKILGIPSQVGIVPGYY